jgi:hypothetical protein
VLESCAKYFFEIDGGKKIRPTMVLAVSYALNSQSPNSFGSDLEVGRKGFASPSQKRLAEITEMIHTASLFHDDVIDKVRTIETILVSLSSYTCFCTYSPLLTVHSCFRVPQGGECLR